VQRPAGPPAAAKPGILAITITNDKGEPLNDANVTLRGTVDRGGVSGTDGGVTLQGIPVGTWRVRITRDGYYTLEKEFTIKSGAKTTTEGVLSVAPPPPPPPAPVIVEKPAAVPAAGVPGTPKMLSISDLAEQMLKDNQPLVGRDIGCSYTTSSQLVVSKDNVASHKHDAADEVLYFVAGEATLTIAGKDQLVTGGWLGFIPRGTMHALTRRGRTPMVFLLVQNGTPCK
jgi:mannose-6-phosphate isomerase-like protein (cupin superfamily)